MKNILICLLAIFSMQAFANFDEYDCQIVKNDSTPTYEAGDFFRLSIEPTWISKKYEVTIFLQNDEVCTTNVRERQTGYLYIENALQDCGLDGINFELDSKLIQGWNEGFVMTFFNDTSDVYECLKIGLAK
jgi:hypothetical protein